MTVTVLYPEDWQVPDLDLEERIFGSEVRLVRGQNSDLPSSTPPTAPRSTG
jgi:hypothetical protein